MRKKMIPTPRKAGSQVLEHDAGGNVNWYSLSKGEPGSTFESLRFVQPLYLAMPLKQTIMDMHGCCKNVH